MPYPLLKRVPGSGFPFSQKKKVSLPSVWYRGPQTSAEQAPLI